MNTQCTLYEWETRMLQGVSLSTCQGREQAKLLTDCGIVEILELVQGLQITSNSHIGRIHLDSITLRITPKLHGLPLVRLLSYAYGLKDLSLHSHAQYEADDLDFFDLLIYALHEYADNLIRRSFTKGYVQRSEALSAVRGRPDIREIASGGGIVTATLPCRYFQREDDTPLNRVLLAGLRLASRMTADPNLAYQIGRNISLLSETVSDIVLSDTVITMVKRAITRLTETYHPALDMIELLYHAQAPQIDAEGHQISLPGYFFDMNRFFEVLVSKLLKTLPDDYSVVDQYRLKDLFAYDANHNPNKRKSPTPRPDFALVRFGRIIQLYDSKYRDLWGKGLPSDMLYQLSTYALSGVENRTATILYPALSDDPQKQVIHIFHPGQGTKIAQVEMQPVNLIKISRLLAEGKRQHVGAYVQECILPAHK